MWMVFDRKWYACLKEVNFRSGHVLACKILSHDYGYIARFFTFIVHLVGSYFYGCFMGLGVGCGFFYLLLGRTPVLCCGSMK